MAENDDSLFREIKEEIRREQMEKIFRRYGVLILGVALLFVLGVAGFQLFKSHQATVAQEAGAKFSEAETLADNKKKDDAAKAFKAIADEGPAGYATLAKLNLAGAEAKDGKTAEAVATYDSLAKQSGADDLLKSYAELQAAALRMADADYAEIQNRLTPLIGDNAPFANTAREFLGIAAYRSKKYDEARKYLEPLLIDPNASEDVQERVKIILGEIAAAEVAANTAPATEPAAPATDKAAEPAKTAEPATTDAKPQTGEAQSPDKNQGSDKK